LHASNGAYEQHFGISALIFQAQNRKAGEFLSQSLFRVAISAESGVVLLKIIKEIKRMKVQKKITWGT